MWWFKRGKVLKNKEGGKEDEIENVFLENSKRIWGTCGRKTYTLF